MKAFAFLAILVAVLLQTGHAGAQGLAASAPDSTRPTLVQDSVERIAIAVEEMVRDGAVDEMPARDLKAQEDMARWAFAMLLVTLASTGVGAFGLYFVWDSLRLNRKAVQAAEAAVHIAEESHAAQSRAWVSAPCSIFSQTLEALDDGSIVNRIRVRCESANHGNSPATHLSFHARLTFLNRESEDIQFQLESFAQEQVDRDMGGGKVLFPGETLVTSHDVLLRPEDAVKHGYLAGKHTMIAPAIMCCVVYRTGYVEGFRRTADALSLYHRRETGDFMGMLAEAQDWIQGKIFAERGWHVLAD
jgi:hypothetical protein